MDQSQSFQPVKRKMDIVKVKNSTIADIKSIIEGLKEIQFREKLSFQFNTNDLQNSQAIKNLLNDIKTKIDHKKYNYIYVLCLQNIAQTDTIYHRYKTAKNNKTADRAYARLNTSSPCLYVGSSKGLVPRIKQHMGFGPKGTYAMQLCHWCENLSLDIVLDIYAFDNDVSKKAFQAFEDGVWDSLKPMLGRQGKK
jgi:hypothetical protein